MARRGRSATSRTSTAPNRVFGTPGTAPFIRRWMPTIDADVSGPSTGPNTAHRVDDEFEPVAFSSDEIPGRALGQGFRLWIGRYNFTREVGPSRLVERRRLRCGRARGSQPSRNDQLVLVFGHAHRKRRSDVQDIVAAFDRLRPASVRRQVGGDERQRRRPRPRRLSSAACAPPARARDCAPSFARGGPRRAVAGCSVCR